MPDNPTERAIRKLWREAGLPEYFLGNGGTNEKLVRFAEIIREQRWINVTLNTLPEPGKRVLFFSRYEGGRTSMTLGWYRPAKDEMFPWRDGFGSGDGPSVTHWMPAMDPPEDHQ